MPFSDSVITVAGPVSAGSLGPTLVHEHLLSDFDTPGDGSLDAWRAVGRALPESAGAAAFYEASLAMDMLGDVLLGAANRDNWRLDDEDLAAAELAHYVARDGRTVVDLTTIGLGRDPAGLRRLAKRTGLNVVMGAGWYHPAWSPEIAPLGVDELSAHVAAEITTGVNGIRAGVIGELGPLDPSDPAQRALLQASARAAAATGAPIYLGLPETPGAAIDAVLAEGVDASRVALAHCERLALDVKALRAILDRGVYVGFDSLGHIPTVRTDVDDHDVAVAVRELAEAGHVDRLLVSQGLSEKINLKAYGGSGYAFLAEQFAPYLKGLGAEDALFTRLTVDNPARLLAFANPEESR